MGDRSGSSSLEQLVKLVHNDKPGREVVVTYVRTGKVFETKMTLSQAVATGERNCSTMADVSRQSIVTGSIVRPESSTAAITTVRR